MFITKMKPKHPCVDKAPQSCAETISHPITVNSWTMMPSSCIWIFFLSPKFRKLHNNQQFFGTRRIPSNSR